jgi:hypothetical protein
MNERAERRMVAVGQPSVLGAGLVPRLAGAGNHAVRHRLAHQFSRPIERLRA